VRHCEVVVFDEWRRRECAGFMGGSLAEWAIMNNTNRLAESLSGISYLVLEII
jgi:hypothetical protein